MAPPDPNAPPQPSGSFIGCALFSLGMLLVIPSGLCTAIGGIGLIVELVGNPRALAGELDGVLPFVVVTLVCLAVGVALVRIGLKGRKR